MIGVAQQDMLAVGQLLGQKTVLNEFIAYQSLAVMKDGNMIHDPKSLLIATYALCGFANFASIGIQIGGISQLAPQPAPQPDGAEGESARLAARSPA